MFVGTSNLRRREQD